ncbi:MAG: RNA-guided endonuclease InsQ/TnpB family protein, partial [Xenococcaceae cyanobacterium]
LKGWLKIRLHRPLPCGFTLKNILLTKKTDGWYATLALEVPTVPIFSPEEVVPSWDNSMGLDAVLYEENYLATSEGTKLPALKSFRKSQSRLAKTSRRKSARKRGSKARRKLAKREGREHQRIARARKDHAYKTAHALVKTNKKVFFVEDLNLRGLTKRNKPKKDENGNYLPNGQSAKSGLNKSWLDAAFGQFFAVLDYIASKAGAVTVRVKPSYTSQLLCYRDEFVFTDCSIREWFDNQLQLWVDRDINAAINVKRVGLDVFPTIKRRKGNPVVTISTTNSTKKEALVVLYECQKPTLTR